MSVPTTMDGWAVRIMTIGIVVFLFTAFYALAATRQLQVSVDELRQGQITGRTERTAYQEADAYRNCLILTRLGATGKELQGAGCFPTSTP